jgi:uncharacterized protein YdhG (YjbR/CyaY superfamily)
MKNSMANDIDDFIASYPPKIRAKLEKLRLLIHETAPGVSEDIAYGIPTFRLEGNLVHFSAYEKHIGFYPGASGVENFREQLTSFKTSKGTIQFAIDEDLPWELIQKIVAFRVGENLAKAEMKKKRRFGKEN